MAPRLLLLCNGSYSCGSFCGSYGLSVPMVVAPAVSVLTSMVAMGPRAIMALMGPVALAPMAFMAPMATTAPMNLVAPTVPMI